MHRQSDKYSSSSDDTEQTDPETQDDVGSKTDLSGIDADHNDGMVSLTTGRGLSQMKTTRQNIASLGTFDDSEFRSEDFSTSSTIPVDTH